MTDTAEPPFDPEDQTDSDRDAREAALAAAILAVFLLLRRRLLAYATEAQHYSDVPDAFWREVETRLQAATQAIYREAFAATASIIAASSAAAIAALRLLKGGGRQINPADFLPGTQAAASAWATAQSAWLADRLTQTTAERLARIIALRERLDLTATTASEMALVLFGEQRATDIAITEITRATSFGRRAMLEELERAAERRLFHERWQTELFGPSNVCPLCGPLDGLVDDEWRQTLVGFEAAGYRFDTAQVGPPLHPRCACGIVLEPMAMAALENPPSAS